MKSLAQCLAHIECSANGSYCCCFDTGALVSAMAPAAERKPSYEGMNTRRKRLPCSGRYSKHFTCIDSSNSHNSPQCILIIPVAQRRKLRHKKGK